MKVRRTVYLEPAMTDVVYQYATDHEVSFSEALNQIIYDWDYERRNSDV